MIIPKRVTLCGREFKVVTDKKSGGGSFSEGKNLITIGTYYKEEIPEIFAHEIFEAILAIRDMRYALQRDQADNGDYKFVFSHKEFEQAMKDVCLAFKGTKFS